ncbi:hypothetical protein DI392_01360 [Vibrio albus]|uniref:Peptidoglycan-binding protein CsiV n=1 Tax=Vibrio albus TaxID=2200953 RepID=A0A2U3BE02_9VIBR|nr:peptidoglycan binding protein CsiV [Vibrio albus]PWI34954.1 hypothetical protein DI392_01360 [Vibrio albus]
MRKLIPLLLLFITLPGLTAERQFDIEVIIFKRAVDAENLQESWPDKLPEIDLSHAALLQNNEYLEAKGVTLLPQTEYQLTEQEEQLRRHAGYQVLVHTAWRQGDEGKGSAPVFHIMAGHDYSADYHPDGSEKKPDTTFSETGITDTSVENELNLSGVEEKTIDNPLYELDGKLQIYVQHYLFLESELDLKAPSVREVILEDKELDLPAEPEVTNDTTVQFGNLESVSPTVQVEKFLKSYRMKQKRRMRSGETHYLDHPLMGIVLQVRKVKEKTE